ncbi:response regulator receiver modulated metal dependent phosphohydrolase [Tindallia magadiensis]|uniref:Stage 0 sporulation protein A homolog n=1 Tax=Tindallia magadiensis TaxID=69895 RepID=A0A1I3ANZ1_9FIRM|nr:HD domain-containing phosphohydrolase [Tindallia magadiensis]SFH51753.1 response regulator receiver modulated metal dependent phosphohydrolase [Tindallia magadiensis]
MLRDEVIKNAKILIVDDLKTNIYIVEKMLKSGGYKNYKSIVDSRNAIAAYLEMQPDIVLLDLMMPYMDGFDIMRELQKIEADGFLPVLVLTANDDMANQNKALEMGARDFLGKPFEKTETLNRIRNILETRILYNQVYEKKNNLEDQVLQRTKELKESQLEIAIRLAKAGEFRDNETGNHDLRVGLYAECIGNAIGMSAVEKEKLRYTVPLHDIGKIGIPDRILLKPGKLTEDEWELMKEHTVIGGQILVGGKSDFIKTAEEVALNHHEKWNGSGYPNGLMKEEIPLVGRIAAICDVFDALISDRPYKKAWSISEAVKEIENQSGEHFDPLLVKAFFSELDKIVKIQKIYR